MKRIKIYNNWADTLNPDKLKTFKFAIQLGLRMSSLGCDWDLDVKQLCDNSDVRASHKYEVLAKRVCSIFGKCKGNRITYEFMKITFKSRDLTVVGILGAVVEACSKEPKQISEYEEEYSNCL